MKKLLLSATLLLVAWTTQAQQLNSKVSKEILTIEGKEMDGYAVKLDFTKKEIFKSWWKYSKEFSRNETKKGNIKHTIPPKEGESTVPIIFFSTVEAPDSLTAKLKAAINDNGMSSDDVVKYNKQVSQLLSDFRTDYYKDNLQRKITNTEKMANKIGKSLDRYSSERIKLDQKLTQTKEEKIAHQQAIIDNDSLIIELIQKLRVNKVRKDSVNGELEKIKVNLDELREMIKGIN